jgi:hypothetical protein
MIGFRDFLLETFSAFIKHPFGTDTNMQNGEVDISGSDEYFTFFKYNDSGKDVFFLIEIDDVGNVTFSNSDVLTSDKSSYSMTRRKFAKPFEVFGIVFYVIGEIVKKNKFPEIRFFGADNGLDKFYLKLIGDNNKIKDDTGKPLYPGNKNILNKFKEAGYIYSGIEGEIENVFVFELKE